MDNKLIRQKHSFDYSNRNNSSIPNYVLQRFHPKYWYKKKSIISYLLVPISIIYNKQFSRLIKNRGKTVDCPVICVGNITVGGTGKTPLVYEIATEAKNQGFKVAIILRGYGRKTKNILKVDISKHGVDQVGDEALCHAKGFDVWVAPNRWDAAKCAVDDKASFIIMDDGLQHRHLHKDVSILLLPTKQSLGNLRSFPAGPLREDPTRVWDRIDACLHEGELAIAIPSSWRGSIGSIIAKCSAKQSIAYKWLSNRVIAFCGIARPYRFYNHLLNLGAKLTATYSFPDHYNYKVSNLDYLLRVAKKDNAQLISTTKDEVRIPKQFQKYVEILPYQVKVRPLKLIPDMIKLAKLRYLVRTTQDKDIN